MAHSLFARLADRFEENERRLSRREALRACAAGALALAGCAGGVRGGAKRSEPSRGGRTGRAIVIGAGFGGLSAGDALASAGWDVTVLEARNRVSGRVTTLHDLVRHKWAEGGGEWIGMNHPTWLALAARFGLDLQSPSAEEGDAPLVLRGERLSAADAESLYHEMDAHLADLTALAASIRDATRPWESPRSAEFDAMTGADWLNDRPMSDLCRTAIQAQFEHDNGVALARMSMLGLLGVVAGGGGEAYWTDSEVFHCAGGNDSLAGALANAIGDERIHLAEPAVRIVLGADGAVVHGANSAEFECDAVVLATPPSTWDRLSVVDDRGAAVALPRVQMGTAMKYLSGVRRAWWRDAATSPQAFSDGLFGYTWNSTDTQGGEGSQIVCAFSGGPAADRLLSLRMERRALCRREVEALLPGFAANRDSDDPRAERVMAWPEDPLTRAGYSFPAPGEVTTLCRRLSDGITVDGRPVLAFAGEHCSCAFVGYMEGALESGRRAAGLLSRTSAGRPVRQGQLASSRSGD